MKKNRPKRFFPTVRMSILILIVIGFAVIFVRNNSEQFTVVQNASQKTHALLAKIKPSTVPRPKKHPPVPAQTIHREAKHVEHHVEPPAPPAPPASAKVVTVPHKDKEPRVQPVRQTVELHDIHCKLADRDELIVVISLRLSMHGDELREEVLLKREDLKVAVRKAMAPMKLSNVVVDKLRLQFKTEMNGFLQKGTIDDIEFMKFQPLL